MLISLVNSTKKHQENAKTVYDVHETRSEYKHADVVSQGEWQLPPIGTVQGSLSHLGD